MNASQFEKCAIKVPNVIYIAH